MPDLRFTPQAAQHTEIPRPKRAEGQWALGYTEPLNKNEQSKKDDDPLNVRDRILYTYSRRGFDSIDPADLRGRFRWMGLYTQRAPGFDGGKTAQLEEEELDDRYFMMRVRTDGAILDAAALRALGEVSTTYGRNTADITDRNNIQYHWIEIESVPAIWERLESVGLSTLEACGDSPRPFLGSPVAGIAKDEIIDGTEALAEIKRRALDNPAFSNLPRKFKTALTGHPSHDVAPEVNDVAFVGTVHPEHGPGFDLWVGGGLSTNPMLAHKLGVWIPLDEVADAWEGVAGIFRDYGYRRLRSKARLKFLLADWGKEKFREVLENEYLHRALVDNPSPEAPVAQGDHIGIHEQKDGRFYVGAAPVVGRIDGTTLSALGDLVERYDARGARLTAYQKLVVIGVAAEDTEAFADDLEKIGLTARPEQLAPLHDGLHRHRVLQARDRRHQGALPPARHRAREALPRPRHRHLGQRQRLPQRVRPHPGRRHRPQGPARHGRRRPPGRGLPGAPRRRARAEPRHGPQAARPQGHQRRPRRLRLGRRQRVPPGPDRGRAVRRLGGPCRRGPAARGAGGGLMTERAHV